MSEIKTPVRAEEIEGEAYDLYYIYDAGGREISPAQIVAALNAAPKGL